jgi:hypothetical protein
MATALTVECPQCGKQASVPESAVGKKARCGGCQHQFVIQALLTPLPEADGEDYGLSAAEAEPTLPHTGRKAAWQETAPAVSSGRSQGQSSLEAVARQQDKPRYETSEYLVMGLYIGGAGLLVATLALGVLIWLLTSV